MSSTSDPYHEWVAGYLALAERAVARAGRDDPPSLELYLSEVPAPLREGCELRVREALRAQVLLEGPSSSVTGSGSPNSMPEFDGYRVESEIGRGALGTVYRAFDEKLQRPVALKVLNRDLGGGDDDEVLAEARRAAALRDSGIVTVHAVVRSHKLASGDTAPALVMELIEGERIDRATESMSYRRRAVVLRSLARALAAAHHHGIVHRDLKPANVLVTDTLEVKVLDFGLAISSSSPTTRMGFTPLYASPEQVKGQQLSTATDVFSLGAVAYRVLTGRDPFEGDTAAEVVASVERCEPAYPRSICPEVPVDLQNLCLACLSREPEQRPSAAEVWRDLDRIIGGDMSSLRPPRYGDRIRSEVAEHLEEVDQWQRHGIVSVPESDQLRSVYRRLLSDEDHWLFDARRLSVPQTALYTGTWMVVVATGLATWLGWDDLAGAARTALPIGAAVLLFVAGLHAHRRRDVIAAGAFLSGAILAVVPAVLATQVEWELLGSVPEDVTQIFPETPFHNLRVLVASSVALALAVFALWRLPLTAFAWCTAVLAAFTYVSWWATRGLLDLDDSGQGLRMLPLVSFEAIALAFERVRRVRFSVPFHGIALIALVASIDVMAKDGYSLKLLGMEGLFAESSIGYYAMALNGVVLLLVLFAVERARSLDLRRGARWIQPLVPIHLLGALYVNAQEQESWSSMAPYGIAVVLLLALGPWRSRRTFLLSALAGVALAGHLVIDAELWPPLRTCAVLAGFGMVMAVLTWRHRHRKAGSGLRGEHRV